MVKEITDSDSSDDTNYLVQDNKFFHLGSHVDKALKEKITRGEYIDLSNLLVKHPKWVGTDNRMDLINKDGHTSWVPAWERDLHLINNFRHWE